MADKIPVVVGKVKVTKSFDTTASKSVPELL